MQLTFKLILNSGSPSIVNCYLGNDESVILISEALILISTMARRVTRMLKHKCVFATAEETVLTSVLGFVLLFLSMNIR